MVIVVGFDSSGRLMLLDVVPWLNDAFMRISLSCCSESVGLNIRDIHIIIP